MKYSYFIDKVKLENYRCHSDSEIGPFGLFNLVYGRNGSGKTSLLEAIELALTGQIFRIDRKENLKDIVARNKREKLSVTILRVKRELASFQDFRNTPPLTNLIWLLYKVNADGRKARFLLPQMFRTHNLLYSEQIVKFLAADEKEKLDRVLSELILGREVMNTWSYLEEANNIISMYVRNYGAEVKRSREEIRTIEKEIKEFKIEDIARLQSLGHELEGGLSLSFWEKSKLPDWRANSDCLTYVRQVVVKIDEAQNHVDSLLTFLETVKKPSKWGDFTETLEERRASREKIEAELKNLIRERDLEADKLTRIEKEEQVINTELLRGQLKLDNLFKSLYKVKSIIAWLPELSAQEKALQIEESIKREKRNLDNWEVVLKQVEKLPEIKELRELVMRISSLKKEQNLILADRKKRSEQKEISKRKLTTVEQKLASIKNRRHRLRNSIKEMHYLLEDVFKLHATNICPACGKPWPSANNLKRATKQQLDTLLEELGKDIDNESGDVRHKTDLEKHLKDLDEKDKLDNIKLSEINELLEKDQKQQLQIEDEWNELKTLLTELGSPLEMQQDKDIVRQIECLERTQFSSRVINIRKNLAAKERNLNKIWAGLRKDEFNKKKTMIDENINSLRMHLEDENITMPGGWELSLREKLHRDIENRQREEQKSLKKRKKSHMEIKERKADSERIRKNYERQIMSIREKYKDIDKKFRNWIDAQRHVDSLMKFGFIKKSDVVNETKLSENIKKISRKANALSLEVESQIKAKKELTIRENRLKKLNNQKERIENCLKRSENIKCRIEKLSAPETFEENIWDEYAYIISDIFRKLHWPQDFSGVYLKRENKNLDLKVAVKKKKDKLRSAHEWLSSGQRTALAISVFWALSSFSKNVPPILLMDEPVQSVDDLNILNFLDGLRWLVDGANRQVFITTANQRVADLIRLKFSYLKDKFLDIHLVRNEGLTEIKYLGWKEEEAVGFSPS